VLTSHLDRRGFPHNVFAELLTEGGLVALFWFLALLAAAFRPLSLDRLRQDPQALCAVMLFACTLLNAMVSGDIPDNRALFMMIGVLAMIAVRKPVDKSVTRAVAQQGLATAKDLRLDTQFSR
jgi:O-antigen ligase